MHLDQLAARENRTVRCQTCKPACIIRCTALYWLVQNMWSLETKCPSQIISTSFRITLRSSAFPTLQTRFTRSSSKDSNRITDLRAFSPPRPPISLCLGWPQSKQLPCRKGPKLLARNALPRQSLVVVKVTLVFFRTAKDPASGNIL